MSTPQLYRQLQTQLSQWVTPKDKRHLTVFAENIAAILQAQSGSLSHWLTYLSHRRCKARSHMERLSYFVHNPKITSETFYVPLLLQFLQAWAGMATTLTLDTSMLWDEYCLIEVCLTWGGRSFPLAQKVLKHGSATVAFADYCSVLDVAETVLPADCQITLLADRGFEHGELIRWLRSHQWSWAIRAKSDLKVTLSNAQTESVADLLPEPEQAFLFSDVTILEDIHCHLATARLSIAQEAWAVITDKSPSVQTFALYGQRFGGIEPHFKDYKSAAFELPRSKLRDAHALSRLLMLLAAATIIAICVAIETIAQGALKSIDWHAHRGLSFLQIGLRRINQLCYQRLPLPPLRYLPRCNPPPAYASLKKRDAMNTRIEFAKVTVF
ncbi:transposase [Altericista sp. CCNU0014]|uniref:transposase n=1 Tax=Altericista sp. CCNU0014 TaxID=3082949 RepID=UPI00384C8994